MEKGNNKRSIASSLFIWILLLSFIWLLWNFVGIRRKERIAIDYTQFMKEVEKGNVSSVVIVEKEISGQLKKEAELEGVTPTKKFTEFKTYLPFPDPSLVQKLVERKVRVSSKPQTPWTNIILGAAPWILFLGLWFLFIRRLTAGQDRAFTFGRSRAKILTENKPKVTFEDVAGVDEAKEELKEVIEFLKAPQKFQKLGGRIPKGVLLVGPTGTGKTLLARAVAGEAGVPFISISGSNFVEMFVGVGAARVRDLFDQGKRNAPCIIFIDEIDAVGRQRGGWWP